MPEQLLACPNCQFNFLDIIVEDGEMIFSCEDCGWQKRERHYFHITAWCVEIHQALAPIDILQSLLTDTHIVEVLKPRLNGVPYLSRFPESSNEYLLGEITAAQQVYMRQMLVLATTYVELILKDFFLCLYIAQPLRMNSPLSPEGKGKATVFLNDVLTADSKDTLVMNLAERAASAAVGPKFDKVVEKIIRECKLKLDSSFIDDLRELNERRNQIIHEGKSEEVRLQQAHNAFGLLLYLVYVLGRAAKEYRIPYRDETGFLVDFEKQLREKSATT